MLTIYSFCHIYATTCPVDAYDSNNDFDQGAWGLDSDNSQVAVKAESFFCEGVYSRRRLSDAGLNRTEIELRDVYAFWDRLRSLSKSEIGKMRLVTSDAAHKGYAYDNAPRGNGENLQGGLRVMINATADGSMPPS